MSGSGFKMGLAISTYEWMAAATLMIVAIFFIPVYLKNKIYTMPQFLSQRYNGNRGDDHGGVLAAALRGGQPDLDPVPGRTGHQQHLGHQHHACMYLLVFAIFITLGGMKVIGYTDVIQVFFLILGGLVTTYLALNLVAEKFGNNGVQRLPPHDGQGERSLSHDLQAG
jgi:SSS family solute:Na+ symporter